MQMWQKWVGTVQGTRPAHIVEVLIPNEPHIPRDNDLGFECMKVWIVGYGFSFLQAGKLLVCPQLFSSMHRIDSYSKILALIDKFLRHDIVQSQHFVIFSYLKEKKILIRPRYKISDSMETLLSILLPKTPKNVQIWQPKFSLWSDAGATPTPSLST